MGKKYYYLEEGAQKGAKFDSIEELKQAIWELFKDKMSKEEFENYIKAKIKEVEE
ncbi:MAG: hypothetical protein ACP5QP_04165 [Brevinematia bacterium]|jgi:hypothetical protein